MKFTIAIGIGILIGLLPFTGIVLGTLILFVAIPALVGLFLNK
jgi:hypothetical protein